VFTRNPIRGTFFGCCAWAETQSAKSEALTRIADLQFRIADFNFGLWREAIQIGAVFFLGIINFAIRNTKFEISITESPYLPAPTRSIESSGLSALRFQIDQRERRNY